MFSRDCGFPPLVRTRRPDNVSDMRLLRHPKALKYMCGWSAIFATILHVALLSLHLTAAFERGIGVEASRANLGVHAFCGVVDPAAMPAGGTGQPAEPGKSVPACPICVGAAPAACVEAPETLLAPAVFTIAAALPPAAPTIPAARLGRIAGNIRGPPAQV